MQLSAEIRWFWERNPPSGLQDWFGSEEIHGCLPGGGVAPRTDLYRRETKQIELGIKLRGSKPGYEVKGLVERLPPLASGPFTGAGEIWAKWSVDELSFDAQEMTATTKLRWIRKVDSGTEKPKNPSDFPQTGCQSS